MNAKEIGLLSATAIDAKEIGLSSATVIDGKEIGLSSATVIDGKEIGLLSATVIDAKEIGLSSVTAIDAKVFVRNRIAKRSFSARSCNCAKKWQGFAVTLPNCVRAQTIGMNQSGVKETAP